MGEYTGIFKARYQTKGRVDWVKLLTEEDKAVFIRMGLAAAEYGRKGGIARARTAKRDARGRFTNGTLRS
jgi:uncharacterized protein with GYD domain